MVNFKLELEFYFDGNKVKQVKSEALSSREDNRNSLWLNLYNLCNSQSNCLRSKQINDVINGTKVFLDISLGV
jgi:hypothetical protein